MRILIAVVVWVGAVIGAVAVSNAVSSIIHTNTATRANTALSVGSSGSASANSGSANGPDPSSIKSTDPTSLFRTANFEKALGKARAALGSGAGSRTSPVPRLPDGDRGQGRQRDRFLRRRERPRRTAATGGSSGATGVFHLSQIGAGVPEAIAHRIQAAAHLPESSSTTWSRWSTQSRATGSRGSCTHNRATGSSTSRPPAPRVRC